MTLTQSIDSQFDEFARSYGANAKLLAERTPAPLDALVLRVGAINAELIRQSGLLASTAVGSVGHVADAARSGASEFVGTTGEAVERSLGTVRTTGRRMVGDARQARTTIANRASGAAREVGRNLALVTDRLDRTGDRVGRAAAEETSKVTKAADAAVAEAADEGSRKPNGAYETWTREQLYERAQELDLDGRSGMTKAQLVKALRSA